MEVYQRNPNIYILAFGMLSAKITNKLVVSYNHSSMLILSLQNAVIQSFFFFFFFVCACHVSLLVTFINTFHNNYTN